MPGELGDESETAGSVRSILGGLFVVHEYRGSLAGESMEGQATLGFHIGAAMSVLGSYEAGDGSRWGWRTTFAQPSDDEFVISHFNIPPGHDEYLGVETQYRRVD